MKPVLLLIPGMLNTFAIWAQVTPVLAGDAEVRIADVQSQASIGDMARDAWALVADVPHDTPVVVCGFSMGGYVALEMLAQAPRKLSALALLDTAARPESPAGAVVRDKTVAAIGRNFEQVVDAVLLLATHPKTQLQPVLMQQLRALMLGIGPAAAIRQNQAIKARRDHRAALPQIEMPVLVMCGRQDRITPPELAEELAALLPKARLEWIEEAGHMTPVEQPQQVARLLQQLLQPLPQPLPQRLP